MEIRARVALSLPNTFYRVTLKYDTFEKATFDSYLIACLVANSNNEEEAMNYIDEISGKGSLNPHFKKMYEEISKFSEEQIDGIIKNSLFPITVIDQKNHFKYYPMFNATRMNNKVYGMNLREHEEMLEGLIMPSGKDIKFLGMDFQEEPGTIKLDNYNAIFSDDGIRVDLDNGQYYSISKENFESVHKNDVEDLGGYLGSVGTTITDGNWSVLNKSIVNTLSNANNCYVDSNGVHSVLYNDCIKTIEIINVFGLYFYKETRYDFTKKNTSKCEDAIKYLLESKSINEYKTKSLIYLLANVDEKVAQEVVQYVLNRKDSKEISELGLKLIKSGLEKGWDHEVLLSIKKQVPSSEYNYLYKLDNDLSFEVEDLLYIDNTDLNENDKIRKTEYLAEFDNLRSQINSMIGAITNSGIREKIKKMSKSSLKDRVKKFVDKRIGHSSKDYYNMSLSQLKNEFEEINKFYNTDYQEILKEIEKNEMEK